MTKLHKINSFILYKTKQKIKDRINKININKINLINKVLSYRVKINL
jgi:hypothetical protein